ncbi:MAG: hypothetical protein ACK5MY_06650 [Jhaorihella sp.]
MGASITSFDLAKQVFQLHRATGGGKKLSRKQFLAFMQMHTGRLVALEVFAPVHCSAP